MGRVPSECNRWAGYRLGCLTRRPGDAQTLAREGEAGLTRIYGVPEQKGSRPGFLDYPDDAHLLENGNVLTLSRTSATSGGHGPQRVVGPQREPPQLHET